MRLRVRVPGVDVVYEITVLDDTGSDYLELFVDDCGHLGFNRHLIPAHLDCGYEDLVTVNGNIRVPTILVEVLVMATDNTPIGALFLVKAALPDAWSFQRQRCSGQGLKKGLVYRDAPGAFGAGNLYVGINKSRIMKEKKNYYLQLPF